MINKPRIQEMVENYGRFKNWLRRTKGLKVTEARAIGIESIIEEYDDFVIDQNYKDKRPFEARHGVNYKTFSDWCKRRLGKSIRSLTEEEKEDLVIDYKHERYLRENKLND